MSADTDGYEPEELRLRGAAYVITKPFYLTELASTRRLVRRACPPTFSRPAGSATSEPGE